MNVNYCKKRFMICHRTSTTTTTTRTKHFHLQFSDIALPFKRIWRAFHYFLSNIERFFLLTKRLYGDYQQSVIQIGHWLTWPLSPLPLHSSVTRYFCNLGSLPLLHTGRRIVRTSAAGLSFCCVCNRSYKLWRKDTIISYWSTTV